MMTTGQAGVDMMVQQQLRNYRSDLETWTRQVCGSRSLLDGLRMASHKPTPGQLIRALSGMTSPEKGRAERLVEDSLISRAREVSADDPSLHTYMRLAQGHWPRVWKIFDEKRRSI